MQVRVRPFATLRDRIGRRELAVACESDATVVDAVIVDLEERAVVDDDFSHTMEPRYSTFHGEELQGLPTHTIVGGEVVVEDGDLRADPGGRNYLHRGPEGASLR